MGKLSEEKGVSLLLEALRGARNVGPGHARSESGDGYEPPSGESEQAIAALWQDLFGIERIGARDNFFEMGGNSLLAIQLVFRLRRTFDVELPMSKLFESPTVAQLARAVASSRLERERAEEIDRMLEEVEGLSPEEVRARLADESRR